MRSGAHTRALGTVLSRLLWPLALETANPTRDAPVRSTPTGGRFKAADRPRLPSGFVALTPEAVPRVRRYDEMSLDGLLHARGKRWETDEESRLVEGFLTQRLDVPDLVRAHGRSPAALMLKLELLGVLASGHPYARMR